MNKKYIGWTSGGAAMLVLLAACEPIPNSNGYTEVPEVSVWSYKCNGDVMMNWEFKEGEKGRYIFNTGSIMVPTNTVASDRYFKRQDGALFLIAGDAAQWVVTNQATGNKTTCKRTTSDYFMPFDYPPDYPPQPIPMEVGQGEVISMESPSGS